MKYIPIIIILAALGLAYLGFSSDKPAVQVPESKSQTSAAPIAPDSSTPTEPETQTSDQAGITVKVTPILRTAGTAAIQFKVVLDTHSGSLNADLSKNATLTDSSGALYQPLSWDGSPPGGHHREGTLKFDGSKLAPGRMVLTIKLSPDDARTFAFDRLII